MAIRPVNYRKNIALNRKARFNYFIEEQFDAGIMLTGTEVKSLRNNTISLNEAYAEELGGELFLINCFIPEYTSANRYNHDPRRNRKLLLQKRQIKRIIGLLRVKGMTVVPLSIYFNNKNLVKVEIAVVRGKKLYDKREAIKQEDWNRQKARVLKEGM